MVKYNNNHRPNERLVLPGVLFTWKLHDLFILTDRLFTSRKSVEALSGILEKGVLEGVALYALGVANIFTETVNLWFVIVMCFLWQYFDMLWWRDLFCDWSHNGSGPSSRVSWHTTWCRPSLLWLAGRHALLSWALWLVRTPAVSDKAGHTCVKLTP